MFIKVMWLLILGKQEGAVTWVQCSLHPTLCRRLTTSWFEQSLFYTLKTSSESHPGQAWNCFHEVYCFVLFYFLRCWFSHHPFPWKLSRKTNSIPIPRTDSFRNRCNRLHWIMYKNHCESFVLEALYVLYRFTTVQVSINTKNVT